MMLLHYYLNLMQILSSLVVVLIQTQTSYLLYQMIHISDISKRVYFLLMDGEYHNCMQISNNCLIAIYDWILTFTWYISLTLDFCNTVVKLHPKAETLTTAHCMHEWNIFVI